MTTSPQLQFGTLRLSNSDETKRLGQNHLVADVKLVTACILSYNSSATLEQVVKGVESQTVTPSRVIVVDNGSEDDTLQLLDRMPDHYEVRRLDENLGVGAGHNIGWRIALADPDCRLIWTLENDSIPPPECLEGLLAAHAKMEAIGSRIGIMLPFQVHPEEPYVQADFEPFDEDRLTFNGALISTEAIRCAGFLREDFFVDQEDREYAIRIKSAGFRIMTDPNTTIIHLGKGKTRRGVRPSVARTYYRYRNETYLRATTHSTPRIFLRVLVRTLAAVVRTVVFEDEKSRRVRARLAAARDGLTANLGKKDYAFLDGE